MKGSKLLQVIGTFSIFEVTNPSGNPGYRVTGSSAGRQLRKQCKTLEAAVDWAGAQAKTKALAAIAPETVSMVLPPDRQFEAREIFTEMATRCPEASLRDLLEFYVKHHQALEPLSLGETLARYGAERTREFNSQSLSLAQAKRMAQELSRFRNALGADTPMASLSTDSVLAFLRGELTRKADDHSEVPQYTNKTFNNRRGYLIHFFRWCIERRFLAINPLEGTKPFRKLRTRNADGASSVQVLTVDQAAALMAHVESSHEARMVPYVALCLFAGIRPSWRDGEITRFDPKFIDFGAKVIHLPRHVTKTGKPRDITLRPNLAAWLKKYPLTEHPIICTNFKKRLKHLRESFRLKHDVLRHTYISMLVAETKSVSDAALQAGNTENIVWANYLRLGIKKEEAKRFWSIRPDARKRVIQRSTDLKSTNSEPAV